MRTKTFSVLQIKILNMSIPAAAAPPRGSFPFVVCLVCLAAYFSYHLVKFSPLSDYFLYTAEFAHDNFGWRLIAQFLLCIGLYLIFAILLFRRVISRAKGTALSPAPSVIERLARLIILVMPAVALSYLLIDAAGQAAGGSWVIWLAASVVIITTVIQAIMASIPINQEQRVASVGKTLAILVLAGGCALALYFWLWYDVIGATFFIGGVGIILLFLVCLLLLGEALIWLNGIVYGATAWLLVIVLLSQFIGGSSPEFPYSVVDIGDAKPETPAAIESTVQNRQVPSLVPAFRSWLEQRHVSAGSGEQGRKYPIFIVAAQGGGQYAAYHTALSLARLYDSCPKLKDHVFAISGVSGGSLGASIFSELLRRSEPLGDGCSAVPVNDGKLEKSVREFFEYDLVTPVVASGLFFDVPTLAIPQLHLAPDRANTLELAVKNAINAVTGSNGDGSSTQFYSSWSAAGVTPALFLNTTSANYGRSTLISQLYMTDKRTAVAFSDLFALVWGRLTQQTEKDPERLRLVQRMVTAGIRSSEYSRPAYFNILEYRPNLQLSLLTAAILSARFPYVTPPGVLYADKKIVAADATLRETTGLQLIDGGFWDNSGIATAIEIIKQLQAAEDTKTLVSNLELHLISFGHSNAALQLEGQRGAQSELVAPITTFEAVRTARSLRQADALAAGFKFVHGYQLFDHEFQAPLSWTLSARMRAQIEARSGGRADPSLCCMLNLPPIASNIMTLLGSIPEFVLDVHLFKKYLDTSSVSDLQRQGLKLFAPNARQFADVVRAVRENSEIPRQPSK
ncbi:hypothetical protein [Bradyrhizobium arachidis]|uniref:hypothetical protein n=1 Tax=Bradyrhizobium arachidis TaxID=858423 RepID=UPI0008EBFFB0|nr:hypothetical protein [Bradyrhizobium arachidis]SFU97205.1 hypothetical protein SAMN05192541_108263 [Bradyrhizobium arachidis]